MTFQNPFVQELAELFARDPEQESTLFNAGATDEQINIFAGGVVHAQKSL